MRGSHRITIAALGLSLSFTGCDASSPAQPELVDLQVSAAKGSPTSMAAAGLLKAVHAATARFNSMEQARRAGYAVASHCVTSPSGTMGFHYVNQHLVDETFSPLEPEALLYAPDANGVLKLVAIEYIVLDVGQARPMFGSQLFDIGGTPNPAPHWSLHVWLYESNPNGMFTPFNPNVSCANAD
jgi:hypothetical protein